MALLTMTDEEYDALKAKLAQNRQMYISEDYIIFDASGTLVLGEIGSDKQPHKGPEKDNDWRPARQDEYDFLRDLLNDIPGDVEKLIIELEAQLATHP